MSEKFDAFLAFDRLPFQLRRLIGAAAVLAGYALIATAADASFRAGNEAAFEAAMGLIEEIVAERVLRHGEALALPDLALFGLRACRACGCTDEVPARRAAPGPSRICAAAAPTRRGIAMPTGEPPCWLAVGHGTALGGRPILRLCLRPTELPLPAIVRGDRLNIVLPLAEAEGLVERPAREIARLKSAGGAAR